MLPILLWLILLVVCWPLAVFALLLYPLVWLILLPFRLVGAGIEGLAGMIWGRHHDRDKREKSYTVERARG